MSDQLVLVRASLNRISGTWGEHDFDVIWQGHSVGRIHRVLYPGRYAWNWGLHFWTPDNVMVSRRGSSADTLDGAMTEFRGAWDKLTLRPDAPAGPSYGPPKWPWEKTRPWIYGRPDGKPP